MQESWKNDFTLCELTEVSLLISLNEKKKKSVFSLFLVELSQRAIFWFGNYHHRALQGASCVRGISNDGLALPDFI